LVSISFAARQSTAIRDIDAAMVTVVAGQITLKDEGTNRLWTIEVQPFLMNEFAVTQQYYSLISQDRDVAVEDRKKPVVDISWADAIQFCNLMSRKAGLPECYSLDSAGEVSCNWELDGYRLPSEAEWEFACRAGSNEARYGEISDIAWYQGNSGQSLREVGTKNPNDWGLYDMLGNTWEWCWDVYDPTIYGRYRVFRGGGWSDPPRGCRASCRRKSHPALQMDDLGFRLVRSLR
jgi:formylglycine-generating enzyme required for sulfatase activity